MPTTPYDLSVGFMQVVEEAADEAGLSLEDLVGQVETVRYSTTVAMNRLLERSGPAGRADHDRRATRTRP